MGANQNESSTVPKTNGIGGKPIKMELPQPAPRRVNLPSPPLQNTSNPQPVNGTTNKPNPTTTKTEQQNHNNKRESSTSSSPTGEGDEQVLPKPITNEEFQAMIPAHFLNNNNTPNTTEPPVHAVTVTVKKPDPIVLPPAPTGPGRVTETITKSTFTETVVTRITDNKLVVPVVIEVCRPTQLPSTCMSFYYYYCFVVEHTQYIILFFIYFLILACCHIWCRGSKNFFKKTICMYLEFFVLFCTGFVKYFFFSTTLVSYRLWNFLWWYH